MSRPSPDSPFPYTRTAAASLTGASAAQVRKLSNRLLKKSASGTGNHLGHNLDDVLRITVSKELLRVGVRVASLHSVFASIEADWPRLRVSSVRQTGACLVLEVGHLGPNNGTGRAHPSRSTASPRSAGSSCDRATSGKG